MNNCYIFNKSLLTNYNYNNATIQIDKLSSLIPPFNAGISGIWLPIIIGSSNTTLSNVDFLTQPKNSPSEALFDPTNCSNVNNNNYDTLQLDASFNCSYCEAMQPVGYKATWRLTDSEGNMRQVKGPVAGVIEQASIVSDCSNGACDTRMRKDDYLQKIPILNQNYLNKFFDFKYLNQFPAASNPGLGFENFITFAANSANDFSQSPQMVIDWRIKETIDEIPYDLLSSQYDSEYDHNKAYDKAKYLSQTCGNFILTKANNIELLPYYSALSGLINDPDTSKISSNINNLLPDTEAFTTPYGFDKDTYYNIFIKRKKVASYWKWNYSSGVLCWYRYYNVDKPADQDTRPIKGVDLYISPGDVFYATNDGPEPKNEGTFNSSSNGIKPCPSGLKVIKGGEVSCVIPSGSEFTYISANIYSKFRSIYDRINKAIIADGSSRTQKQKFDLAALLATAPEYDETTVDLTKRNSSYSYVINNYFQISGLNIDMLSGTEYGSVGKLNYIKNSGDLINTLANKYGAYLWCPPNTTSTIQLSQNVKSQCLIDLDFDVVTSAANTRMGSRASNCSPTRECADNTLDKNFSYSQKFILGNLNLESRLDTSTRFNAICKNNTITSTNSVKTASLLLNNTIIKDVKYNSGCYTFLDNYPRILVSGDTPANNCCNNYNDLDNYPCNFCDPDSTYYLPNVNAEGICKNFTGNESWCDSRSANFFNNNMPGTSVGDRPARNILNNTLYYQRSYYATAFNPHIDYVAFHHQGGVFLKNGAFSDNPSGTTVFTNNATSLFNDNSGGTCKLEFVTKDVGIKLYAIKIEKLRSNTLDSSACRAFPIINKCQCFNLVKLSDFPYKCSTSSIRYSNSPILYTPNISTQFSPPIKAYGGYSLSYINKLLGGGEISSRITILKKEINNLSQTIEYMELVGLSIDKDGITLEAYKNQRTSKINTVNSLQEQLTEYRIPNHPDPGNSLPVVNKYIDPIYPYGKNRSVTVTLNNYLRTDYNISLPSYDTIHADVWAEIIENVDLFKPIVFNEYRDEDEQISPNVGYQRFANKVVINNATLYAQQKGNVASKSSSFSSSASISITNPYLAALTSSESILYPPFGSLCQKNIFSSRGDETSSVSIKFDRIPRKQILNFFIKKPKAFGALKKGFFHPNNGLTSDIKYTNKTPIIQYNQYNYIIDYDKASFSPDADYGDSGIILYGEMNDTIRRTISQINNFDNHRKLRLHLFINNQWYEYSVSNIGGFYNSENKLNIGPPFVFEYLSNEKDATAIGPWLPTSPKTNIDFNFIYNYPIQNTRNPNLVFINNNYLKAIKNENNPKKITLEGVRPYFYIAEKDSAVVIAGSTIESISSDEAQLISYSRPEIILNNGTGLRYRYINGSKNQKSSYILSDYNYLYTNFSDLHINYSLTNVLGHVYNTKKICEQEILIIDALKPDARYPAKIIEKNIYSHRVDQYGNKISSNNPSKNTYIKIYTELILDSNLRYDIAYLDFNRLYKNDTSTDGIDSFLVFRDLKPSLGLKKETDHILYNPIIETKWGDLIDFNEIKPINEITNYIYNKNYLNRFYPSTQYFNHFYKTIVNNANYSGYNFLLKTKNNTINLYTTGLVYYTIHQKYNVDYYNSLTQYDYLSTNNYLPFMDINILPNPGVSNNNIRDSIKSYFNFSNDYLWSGLINISGIYKNLDSNHNWGNYLSPTGNLKEYFWINLDKKNKLRSSLTLQNSANGFYSNTLRINDTPFQLTSIKYSGIGVPTSTPTPGCRAAFRANIPRNDLSISSSVFDFSHFQNTSFVGGIFARYPIYCDSDTVENCSSKFCGISTVGWDSFYSEYATYIPNELSINNILNTNNIPYVLSYDGGFYTPIGSSGINYIQRFELSPDNTLFPESPCNSTNIPRPNDAKISILSEEYQRLLTNSIVDDHLSVVTNTDTIANEMLFRLVYGEQQKINLDRIDNLNDYVQYKDLYKYIEPRVEAKDIYKNIPYDLDITADCSSRKINGSISIDGVLELNKQVDVTIAGVDMQFRIEKDNDTGAINIRLYCSSLSAGYIDSKIYEEKTISENLIIASDTVSGPGVTRVATCTERAQINIHFAHAITQAEVTKTSDCSAPSQPTATAYFPHKYACEFFSIPGTQKSCVCGEPDRLPIYFMTHNTCGGQGNPDPGYYGPDNRGVRNVEVIGTIFNSKESTISVNDGDKSRGVFRPCVGDPALLVTSMYNCGVNTNLGRIEDIPATTLIIDYASPTSFNDNQPCYEIDSQDSLTNGNRYNPLGRGYPPNPGSTTDACECKDYTYGYCRNGNCGSSTYTEFPYTFEYCRHSITLMGHKKR